MARCRVTLLLTALLTSLVLGTSAQAVPGQEAAQARSRQQPEHRQGFIAFVSDRVRVPAINDDIWIMEPRTRAVFQMTSDPAPEQWPAISPDGRQLAFIRWATATGGPTALYVCPILRDHGRWVCGKERLVTNQDNPRWPTWTPDSKKVLFDSITTVDIYSVSVRGGTPINLTPEP
jgi:Tol biopolymer transport system component